MTEDNTSQEYNKGKLRLRESHAAAIPDYTLLSLSEAEITLQTGP